MYSKLVQPDHISIVVGIRSHHNQGLNRLSQFLFIKMASSKQTAYLEAQRDVYSPVLDTTKSLFNRTFVHLLRTNYRFGFHIYIPATVA
jgi:hypothetical protein